MKDDVHENQSPQAKHLIIIWSPLSCPTPLPSANPCGSTSTAEQSDQLLPTSGPPLWPKAPTTHLNYCGHQLMLPAFSLPCLLTLFTHTATRVILWKYKWDCYFSVTICSKSSRGFPQSNKLTSSEGPAWFDCVSTLISSLFPPASPCFSYLSLLAVHTLNTSPSQDLCMRCYVWLMLSSLMGMAHSLAAFNFCLCPTLSNLWA